MATYFNILAWRIPWTEKPGELQSKESKRVGRTRPSDYTLLFKELKMFSFSKHAPPPFPFQHINTKEKTLLIPMNKMQEK